MTEMGARIEASIATLMTKVGRGNDHSKECKAELELDIANMYATKLEVEKLEGKFKVFAAQIVVSVSVAVFFIQLGFQIWGGK